MKGREKSVDGGMTVNLRARDGEVTDTSQSVCRRLLD
jgi:hypothetical protein